MLSKIAFKGSKNQVGNLKKGKYYPKMFEYINEDTLGYIVLVEYVHELESEPSASELAIYRECGTDDEYALVRDFIRLADGSWQDSSGNVEDSYHKFMPEELLEAAFIKSELLEPINVK